MDDEYTERANRTLAMRLLQHLHDSGKLSGFELADLLYPSQEALEAAEEQMK